MRNENGFGSIVCLDKTGKKRRKPWGVRITVGWDNRKQIRKYLGYYKTQAEALMALAEYHKNGYDIDSSKLTLEEVFDQWISRIEKKSSKTVLQAHNMTKNRLGTLGTKPIKDIKLNHLQDWMDDVQLKPSSKIRIKSTMSQLFDYAVKNDIIMKNYARSIEVDGKIEKTGSIFTEEEIKLLWDIKDDSTARWILILIYTGMRIGELLEMKIENIHFDEGYMIGGNKTPSGIDRVIPIHNKIIPLLKEQLGKSKTLMRNSHGNKMTYLTAKRNFDTLMEKFGWDHNPHDTRKTGVSLMHSSGIPIETVRIIVGHSGKGITEKVYMYKEPKELVEIINTMEIPY